MATEREYFQEVFKNLKPACDAFVTEPNKEMTNNLKFALASTPKDALHQLQPYVLIPIEIHFKTNNSKYTQNVLDALITLLECTSVSLWPTFMRIYIMLGKKLSEKQNLPRALDLSEDIKLSILTALNLLIEKADATVLNQLYDEIDCKNVGFLIYICIGVIKYEKMNILRIKAIKCVHMLSTNWIKNTKTNDRLKIALKLIKFIPGILSTCCYVVKATDIQHHSITVAVLNLWSTVSSLTICDSHMIEDYSNPYLDKLNFKNKNENKIEDENENIKKLSDWIQENLINFNFVASNIIKSREHNHWRVRLQLVNSCDVLLNTCTKSLKSSVTCLIETLIILSDDEQHEVEIAAKKSFENLHTMFDGKNKKSLMELLEESFYLLLSRMPLYIRTSTYTKQMTELSLLSGYIKLFGKTYLSQILNSYAHLDRLTMALIQVLELEYKTVTLLEESSIRDLSSIEKWNSKTSLNVPWKQLMHFNDTSALQKIEDICKLIGLYGDCNFIGRYLMDIFESKVMYRREITLLINMVLSENCGESHYNIVKDIIELYLERDFWYLPIKIEDNPNTISIADVQKNVVQVCLMTEGLSQLVSSLHVANQNLCLIHCLYPILERVGSELGPVSLAGQKAIMLISQSGGYNDPIDLVVKNSDYLSHHFTSRLWSLSEYPEVLNALKVVMNLHGSDHLLRSFHSIVTDVLVQSCDVHRSENMFSFLKVFHIFVICVNKWQQKCTSTTERLEKLKHLKNSVTDNILEYHKMMTMDFNDKHWENENNTNISSENEIINEENEKPLPPYIQMVLSIMKRVLHFLPSKQYILPLQILNEGLNIISSYENHLLPMVHKIWSPLCTKFNNSTDDMVFREAFNVLTTMALKAKDFIRSRSLKNVLPAIIARLTSSEKESRNISKESVYFTSHKYKLQYTILCGLGDFIVNLNLIEKDMYDVFNAVAHYLDINQPIELQVKSKEFYTFLCQKHPDFVWIYLQSLYIDEYEYKSNNELLPSIKIYSSSKFKKSSTLKNVSELLEKITTF